MANILCIESSGDHCSVSVFSYGELIWDQFEIREKSHAKKLPLMVRDALATAGKEKIKLDAVSASSGPGSYTGLRIGISLAKGLCLGFGIPLISLPTMRIMVQELPEFIEKNGSKFFISMIDARRMEVYYSVFDQNGRPEIEDQALILEDNSFKNYLSEGQCTFFGNGSDKLQSILIGEKSAIFSKPSFPKSSFMGKLSSLKFDAGEFVDLAYFEPKYVKEVFVTVPKPIFK